MRTRLGVEYGLSPPLTEQELLEIKRSGYDKTLFPTASYAAVSMSNNYTITCGYWDSFDEEWYFVTKGYYASGLLYSSQIATNDTGILGLCSNGYITQE